MRPGDPRGLTATWPVKQKSTNIIICSTKTRTSSQKEVNRKRRRLESKVPSKLRQGFHGYCLEGHRVQTKLISASASYSAVAPVGPRKAPSTQSAAGPAPRPTCAGGAPVPSAALGRSRHRPWTQLPGSHRLWPHAHDTRVTSLRVALLSLTALSRAKLHRAPRSVS